jgi:hypothetical protein
MPYILTKTSGTTLTVVQDATVNNSTSLKFVGRNFSGYGQDLEENFVSLLENFNNNTAPTNPVQGQLWFNYQTQQLNVCYDGVNFKGIGSITIGSTSTIANPQTGDLFWSNGTLIGYDAVNGYSVIGPSYGTNFSYWEYGRELSNSLTQNTLYPSIVAYLGNIPVITVSDSSYVPSPSPLTDIGVGSVNTFTVVQAGITLPGVAPGAAPITNPNTWPVPGSSINAGYYFWGTAAEALASTQVELNTVSVPSDNNYSVPFLSNSTGTAAVLTTSTFFYNPSTGVLNATATAAYYADLAERYEADQTYDVGTVLVLGGSKEVTTTTKYGDVRVAGIVSKNPAYMMNSDAGTDETHPYIALKGRVLCKVYGRVARGDLLVTSEHAGYAEVYTYENNPNAVIAKAIESNSDGFGVIEVMVI